MTALIGYCDIHKTEPAVVAYTGPETGGRKLRFCKPCWDTYRHKGKRTNKED